MSHSATDSRSLLDRLRCPFNMGEQESSEKELAELRAVSDMLLLDGNCSDHTLTGPAKLRRILDDLIEARRSETVPTKREIPAELYDGMAVYVQLGVEKTARIRPDMVSDVLDAVVKLIRKADADLPHPGMDGTAWQRVASHLMYGYPAAPSASVPHDLIRDASRYRWLREAKFLEIVTDSQMFRVAGGDNLDKTIDMAATP